MARSRAVDIGDMARDIQENPHLGDEMRIRLGDMARRVEKLSALLGTKAMRMINVGSGLAMAYEGAGGVLGEPDSQLVLSPAG